MAIRLTEKDLRTRGIKLPGAAPQVKARAKTKKPGKYYPYRSKTDKVFAENCVLLCQLLLGKRVVEMRYESIVFVLLGASYKCDFLLICEDGETMFVECKGTRRDYNYRDARSKLRAAAALHYYWTFVLAEWPEQKEGDLAWKLTLINPEEFTDE